MRLTLEVNGIAHEVEAEDRRLLVDVLRDELGLTGTNVGCGHGVCGSCTVHVDGRPVRSCLMLAAQASGRRIRTVEDLAGADGSLHPLQEAFSAHHALQCGFCTPGFLMTALPAVEAGAALDRDQARELVSGNLCRCTGYDGIVDAVVEATANGTGG
jgi:aerobic-type carbon monoxide dehydrogenase small subunit (CoxS/CutS family)